MACLDYATWLKASQACQASMPSVKGFGYVATGKRGLRGYGDINNLAIQTSTPTDPCTLAQQTPCPQPTPASLKTPMTPAQFCAANPMHPNCQPGGSLFCRLNPTDYTCQTAPLVTDSLLPTAGGFNQWGLLAALAVGGTAIYLVTRKKKPASA